MPAIVRTPLPVLLTVIVFAALGVPCVWLPKIRLIGLSATFGVRTPLPLNVAVRGEPGALSETLRTAVRGPVALGLKTTEMAQVAFAANPAPHVDVKE